jgi:hypothetical protein
MALHPVDSDGLGGSNVQLRLQIDGEGLPLSEGFNGSATAGLQLKLDESSWSQSMTSTPWGQNQMNAPLRKSIQGVAVVIPHAVFFCSEREVNTLQLVQVKFVSAFLSVAREAGRPSFVTDADIETGAARFMHLKLEDDASTILKKHFGRAFRFIDAARAAGHRVMIYCRQGQSRSASFAAAYLMREAKIGFQEALERLRAFRRADPNFIFCRQLDQFEKDNCNVSASRSQLQLSVSTRSASVAPASQGVTPTSKQHTPVMPHFTMPPAHASIAVPGRQQPSPAQPLVSVPSQGSGSGGSLRTNSTPSRPPLPSFLQGFNAAASFDPQALSALVNFCSLDPSNGSTSEPPVSFGSIGSTGAAAGFAQRSGGGLGSVGTRVGKFTPRVPGGSNATSTTTARSVHLSTAGPLDHQLRDSRPPTTTSTNAPRSAHDRSVTQLEEAAASCTTSGMLSTANLPHTGGGQYMDASLLTNPAEHLPMPGDGEDDNADDDDALIPKRPWPHGPVGNKCNVLSASTYTQRAAPSVASPLGGPANGGDSGENSGHGRSSDSLLLPEVEAAGGASGAIESLLSLHAMRVSGDNFDAERFDGDNVREILERSGMLDGGRLIGDGDDDADDDNDNIDAPTAA